MTSGDVIEAAYRLEQELREHVPAFPLASCAVRHVLEKHLLAAFLRSQADAESRVAEERARCADVQELARKVNGLMNSVVTVYGPADALREAWKRLLEAVEARQQEG